MDLGEGTNNFATKVLKQSLWYYIHKGWLTRKLFLNAWRHLSLMTSNGRYLIVVVDNDMRVWAFDLVYVENEPGRLVDISWHLEVGPIQSIY